MSDFAIWNSTLTEAQIVDLYSFSENPLTFGGSKPVLYYAMSPEIQFNHVRTNDAEEGIVANMANVGLGTDLLEGNGSFTEDYGYSELISDIK